MYKKNRKYTATGDRRRPVSVFSAADARRDSLRRAFLIEGALREVRARGGSRVG